MRSVPQSLREGAFGLGASKFQVALRVVFPAALSGIVASIVLAMSRAVGETMVVLIAGGQQPQWGADVGKSMETLTAFIGATAKGDAATGIDRVQDDLRRRHDAVRDHARDEPDLDPLRPQVQAGVRVSPTEPAIGPPSRSQPRKDLAFRLALLACLAIAIGLLVVLLVDVALDGAGTLTWDFINNFTSITADKAGIQAGLWGTIWLMGVCALFIVPVGVATAIYLEEYADTDRGGTG